MSVAAFALIAAMITVYVVLDGYDLGVATVLPAVARSRRGRAGGMAAIGPFWNGNEVWLIAAGAVLFALFPRAYASAFSGFYLPFVIVLWLLMFRGIAMELREHFESDVWHDFWDTAFSFSSALLVLLFGITLGNLLRGLPLAQGYFMGTFGYLLNGYALLVGLFAIVVLAQHGLAFLSLRVDGALADRARSLGGTLWWATLAGYLAVTAATIAVRGSALIFSPLAAIGALSLLALLALRWFGSRRNDLAAFAVSSLFIVTLLAEASATLFPYLLPAQTFARVGISIADAQPNPVALATALATSIAGLAVVVAYATFVVRKMSRRVTVED